MARILALVAILWLAAVPAWAAEVTVVVSAESVITGPYITLGEVATITGDNQDRVKALGAIRLGTAPPPGQRMALTGDVLGTRLSGAGGDYSDVAWQVPGTFVVTTASQTIGGDRLLAVAAAAVQKQIGDGAGSEVTVAPLGASPDILAPVGKVDVRAEVPGGIRYNMPTIAAVAISTDERLITTVYLRFDVKAYQQVVVAARNIAIHEALTADNVRKERREVGRIAGYITDLDKVIGLTAHRPLLAGTPLTEALVDKPVVITRGATVTILVQVGDLVVVAAGQVMEAGREGELIRVQNVATKRIVSARVIDGNTVQVVCGGRNR